MPPGGAPPWRRLQRRRTLPGPGGPGASAPATSRGLPSTGRPWRPKRRLRGGPGRQPGWAGRPRLLRLPLLWQLPLLLPSMPPTPSARTLRHKATPPPLPVLLLLLPLPLQQGKVPSGGVPARRVATTVVLRAEGPPRLPPASAADPLHAPSPPALLAPPPPTHPTHPTHPTPLAPGLAAAVRALEGRGVGGQGGAGAGAGVEGVVEGG
jgi:hypothetical protein